eukprot:144873-Pyramimonas_sp.AAC.1
MGSLGKVTSVTCVTPRRIAVASNPARGAPTRPRSERQLEPPHQPPQPPSRHHQNDPAQAIGKRRPPAISRSESAGTRRPWKNSTRAG